MTATSRAIAWATFCCLVAAVFSTSAQAQITFSDFSNVSSLALNGAAAQATNGNNQFVLRVTPDGSPHVSGTAWYKLQQQSVGQGFTSVFQFQITSGSTPADGLSFVIQNSSGEGGGIAALGGSGGAIGYGAPDPNSGDTGTPIPNSLAIEFDTYQNEWDPDANHIAIQSCGLQPNTQDHNTFCKLGLVSNPNGVTLADGAVHTVVIDYDPGTLRIYLDNSGAPVLSISTDLSTLLSLNGDSAWVGFAGGTGALTENDDVLNWTFTPATAETVITQTLDPGATNAITNYVFGSYNHKVEYSNANAGDSVTVTTIPIDQATFHNTRLTGTPFDGAQCVIYDGTGGLCVVFEVTCSATTGNDCTDLDYTLFNNFNTQTPITGACVLKAPIGTNSWQNIIQSFTQTRNDPGSTSGSKGFSDFVLAQNCTAPPVITINSPLKPASSFYVGQAIPIDFSCSSDPNAPQVTVTSCTGNINGEVVRSGSTFKFRSAGDQSLVVTASDSVLDTSTKTSTFTVLPDTILPNVTASAIPSNLWPPTGVTVPVTVKGIATDGETGVNPNYVFFKVVDEYGEVQPSGNVTLQPFGFYSFQVGLVASNHPEDEDGRHYTITVTAKDRAGNANSSSTVVVVAPGEKK